MPGKVKTRLARVLGDAEALRIYHFLLEKTRAAVSRVDAVRMLFYSEYIPQADDWPDELFRKRLQAEGDLGVKMASAFQLAFEEGASKAMIMGSDCPEIDAELLERAFQLLDEADYVLGPASDGGYYLLGMKAPTPELFKNIAWSTSTVFVETLKKIKESGASFALLPVLTDIDEAEDWRKFNERMSE